MLKHKGIKLPRRERVVDYWPGMCSSCFQKTENLNSFVLYTAHKQEENIGTYGGYSNVRLKHTRVYEHPCRLCNRCRFPIKALAIGMLKSMIPAIIVGSLVYFTLHDYTKILWSGVNRFGEDVSAGVYLISLQTPQTYAVERAILIK